MDVKDDSTKKLNKGVIKCTVYYRKDLEKKNNIEETDKAMFKK